MRPRGKGAPRQEKVAVLRAPKFQLCTLLWLGFLPEWSDYLCKKNAEQKNRPENLDPVHSTILQLNSAGSIGQICCCNFTIMAKRVRYTIRSKSSYKN